MGLEERLMKERQADEGLKKSKERSWEVKEIDNHDYPVGVRVYEVPEGKPDFPKEVENHEKE